MRSKLFVPGSRPELFSKALAGQADALSFDLEDSVIEACKKEARTTLQGLLQSELARSSAKVLIVRVNGIGSRHFADDINAVVQPGVALINLPKVEAVHEVVLAVEAIARAERSNGFVAGRDSPVGLLLNVESPRALRVAAELACADRRVAGLQLGLGDLFEPLGIARHRPQAVASVMLALRLAAGEAGVFAYDGAYTNIADPHGYRAEAALARTLGFLGKSCIHPSQVPLANEAFRPTDAEIVHATRVVTTAASAAAVGAFVVDGRMVDAPFIARAEQVLVMARRLGLT